jgi:hypothetical protein
MTFRNVWGFLGGGVWFKYGLFASVLGYEEKIDTLFEKEFVEFC